jgi:hypothetical protein
VPSPQIQAGLNFIAERSLEDDLPTTNDKISNPPAVCIAKGLVEIRSVLVIFFCRRHSQSKRPNYLRQRFTTLAGTSIEVE